MGGQRNSSIELLRIIAMFMILAHHFIVHNGYDVKKLPLGPERIFFQLVMAGGGKVGVVIFFSISAWFFLDKEQTIKSNLKRVWIMERELLFWSLTLVAFYLVFDRADFGMKLMAKSFTPLSMNVWWYATAYAIFLALLPFLSKGLKALGREYHLALAATVLTIWGLLSFIPGAQSLQDNVFRLYLRVHPHLRVQVVYKAVHYQADMADNRHRIRILPSLHRRIRSAVPDGA